MALTDIRLTPFAGVTPSRGTYPIKANVRVFKGALVCLDSAGRAMPGGLLSAGVVAAVGKASATYDNRTGSTLGGAAGAVDVEVEFGTYQWANSAGGDAIAADDVGKVCYVVDDQTVALTNGTDTRGLAGFITEVVGSKPYVFMGPHVAGMIVIAASEASQLDTAQTDIDTVEAEVDVLQVNAVTANEVAWFPMSSFLDADGDPLAKFVDGASATPGFNVADSEAFGIRWNNHASPSVILGSLPLGYTVDDTAAASIVVLASKVGATLGDAVTFLSTLFFVTVGAAHDADANAGGTTGAMTGNSTTKTVQQVTLAVSAADLPAGPTVANITIKPTDGTLGTDDVIVHAIGIRHTRKVQTS